MNQSNLDSPVAVEKRFNIWMITKWYPNRDDPQFGVYIQKHARAINLYNNISVLYIHSTLNIQQAFESEVSEKHGFKEIIIYYKRNTSSFGKILNFFSYCSSVKKGVKILNESNPDPNIIHAYILSRTGVIAWYLSRLKRIPFVISEQWSGYATGKYLNSSFIKKSISKYIVGKASALMTVSKFLRDKMSDCGLRNRNSFIIPNAIESVEIYRVERNFDVINVLIVADLVDEIKNISSVIRMISELKNEKEFILRIVGGGEDESKLKKLAADYKLLDSKIYFEGLKNNKEVYNYLMQCDFIIMNSRFETFSLICAEAMSCGKPVIATRCGGPNEFVKTETGILIEPGNNEELKTSFRFMLSNFGNYNAEHIEIYANELFSIKKIAEGYQTLYSSISRNSSN